MQKGITTTFRNRLCAGALGLTIAIALAPSASLADASNYNFLQLEYSNGELAGFDMHGWQARGSYRFHESMFAIASFTDLDLNEEIENLTVDSESAAVGLGYIFAGNATASIHGTASYREYEGTTRFLGSRGTDSLNGYDLGLAARINLSPEAELKLAVNYIDFGDGETLTVPSAALVYRFSRHVAGVVDYSEEDSYEMLGLGFRFYF